MKSFIIIASLTLTTLFISPCMAESPKFDLSFSTNSGKVLILDTFMTIKKSDVDVQSVIKMQSTIDKLSSEVESLSGKLKDMEKRLRELERKK